MSTDKRKELRILDAWIGEHVFEIKRLEETWMQDEAISVWREQPQCQVFMAGFSAWPSDNPEEGPIVEQDWPCYTTNDADAMAVLRACAEKSHDPIQINKHHCYWAVFTIDVGPARSETLPEAICLFAKKLHGG